MNGIVININPVIVRIGGFAIRWYSLAVLTAVGAAVFVALREASRKRILPDEVLGVLPWLLAAGVVGAKLFHVIDQWQYYVVNPLEVLRLQQGGLAIWGALVGGGLAVVVYARVRHIPLGRFADIFTPALLVGQVIGRFGCIVNGDAAGGITNLPWGFIYTNPAAMISPNLLGVPTHPYPVYEMIWNIASLAVLLAIRRYFKKDGLLFAAYAVLYGVGRFILTFVRQENVILFGLQQAQILAIAIMVIAATAFVLLLKSSRASFNTNQAVLN